MKKQLPLLTDQQCNLFLKEMRDFGYPSLTFKEVRETANELHAGIGPIRGDVIAVIMEQQMEAAMEDAAQ